MELHRFQTTMSVLQVYYQSMSSRVLFEMPSKLAQIHLLEEMQYQSQRQEPPWTQI